MKGSLALTPPRIHHRAPTAPDTCWWPAPYCTVHPPGPHHCVPHGSQPAQQYDREVQPRGTTTPTMPPLPSPHPPPMPCPSQRRYLLVSRSMTLRRVCLAIKAAFPSARFQPPRSVAPKWLLAWIGPWVGLPYDLVT